ncbi:hypothetical protein SNEBB_010712 [Seison nebaliae]|nr:hypothetical protein SNEBB_010712 [Seison nebaliae]
MKNEKILLDDLKTKTISRNSSKRNKLNKDEEKSFVLWKNKLKGKQIDKKNKTNPFHFYIPPKYHSLSDDDSKEKTEHIYEEIIEPDGRNKNFQNNHPTSDQSQNNSFGLYLLPQKSPKDGNSTLVPLIFHQSRLKDHPPDGNHSQDEQPSNHHIYDNLSIDLPSDNQEANHEHGGNLSNDHPPDDRPPGLPNDPTTKPILIPDSFTSLESKTSTTSKPQIETSTDYSTDLSRLEPDILAEPESDISDDSKNKTTPSENMIKDNQIFQEMVNSRNSSLKNYKPTTIPLVEGQPEDLDIESNLNETQSSNLESENNETSQINVEGSDHKVDEEKEEIKEIDDFDLTINSHNLTDGSKKIVCDPPVDKLLEHCRNEKRNLIPEMTLENHNKIFLYLKNCLEISSNNRLIIDSKQMYPVLPETLAFTTQTWKENLPISMTRPEFQGPYTQFQIEFLLKNFGENGIFPQSLDKFRKENFNYNIKLKTSKLSMRNDLTAKNEEEIKEIRQHFTEHFIKKTTREGPKIPEEYMMNVVNMTESADQILRKIYYLHHFRIMGIITTNYFNTIYCMKFSPTRAFSSVFRTIPNKLIREECSYVLIETYDHRHVYNGIHLLEGFRKNFADVVIRN